MARGHSSRRIRAPEERTDLDALAARVRYSGSPYHKRNPGDFGLHPPALPRHDKTLCDEVGIVTVQEATRLLREGVRRGLISVKERGGFPQLIWAVSDGGTALEARLENQVQGLYHGYPLAASDPVAAMVLKNWELP